MLDVRPSRSLLLPLLFAASLLPACTSGDGSSSADLGVAPPDLGPDLGPSLLLHVPSPAWEEQVIYMVMTDRFANGDPGNDDQKQGEYDPRSIDKYSGGDLQGLIDKLDYIKGLGATAVWITPPVANMWWDPLQQSGGYHGYWARHLKKVDEHLGTLETYQKLSSELHKRGMYLIQDVVPNHMGNFFTYSPSYDKNDVTKNFVRNLKAVPTGAPEQAPFDQNNVADPAQKAAAIYHWTPAISDYNDRTQELTYQISDLDDINTENPVVRTALRDSYAYWIKTVGVDAFRVDTAKFVDHDFWNDFFWSTDSGAPGMMAAAKATGRSDFFAFGEVFESPPELDAALETKVASYLGTRDKPELPAVLGFPMYGEIGRVFSAGKPTSYMTYRLGKFTDPALYPDYLRTPTFVDNHDVQRFLATSTEAGLGQAMAFVFTAPGIPIVYYGTEQKFVETRQAMFAGGFKASGDSFSTEGPMFGRIQQLAALRKASKALTHGTIEVLYDSDAGPGAFAFRRSYQSEQVLVLMNTAEEDVLFAQLATGLPAGSVLELLYKQGNVDVPKVGAGGLLDAVVPGRAVLVLRPTGKTETPTPPAATITVDSMIEGKTYTEDVTFTGTVSPKDSLVWLILDGLYNQAQVAKVAPDGTWSVTLGVSGFPTGTARHSATFGVPGKVWSKASRFTTSVVFKGVPIEVDDPQGDDVGPKGLYKYPQDQTFGHQGDITHVRIEAGPTTMAVKITMKEWTTSWNPPNGFDHVAFHVFLTVPGKTSATALPRLNASLPGGEKWMLEMFSYGWLSPSMWSAEGATANAPGAVLRGPSLQADAKTRTITYTFDRRIYGVASWSGTKVYIADWDFDGIKGVLRPLTEKGGQWLFAGGGPPYDPNACYNDTQPPSCESLDPKILDDVGPIAVP